MEGGPRSHRSRQGERAGADEARPIPRAAPVTMPTLPGSSNVSPLLCPRCVWKLLYLQLLGRHARSVHRRRSNLLGGWPADEGVNDGECVEEGAADVGTIHAWS